jgi:FMN phosphatase YigB (HAD superfamily)
MVGDTIADDIEGAQALGMRAILLDREGVHPEFEPRAETLTDLPGLLGSSSFQRARGRAG